jgi:GNAT superfamily N-acetyltransferase
MREEGDRLRTLRLAALAADPAAFASTYERDAALPASEWRRRAAASELGAEQRTFVLVDDADRWLGLALAHVSEQRPGVAGLSAMWVAPEARRHRGAVALCDACWQWARARGFNELVLGVIAGNDGALRAYEAAGFTTRGETTWSQGDRTLEVVVMARRS